MYKSNILIIDDDQTSLSFLNEFLKNNYNVKIAYNGLSALKILDKTHIDLILLDVQMPEMDGYEIAKQIISNNHTKNIPFIFLTADDSDESIEKGFNLGAKDFIKKPYRQKELEIRIKNIITTYNQQKQLDKNQKTISEIQSLINDYLIYSETDLNGKITYVSKSFCVLSGYEEDELLGKSHNVVRHPDMNNSVFKDLWTTIKTKNTWKGEIKNLTKDGHYYWVYATVSPKYDDNNNHIGYVSLRQEITAKKEAEQQEIRLLENIRMESLKDLLSNISHHWRQPLTTITTISSGIKIERQYDMFDLDSLDEKLDHITESAFFLSKTIEDFSSFISDNDNSNFEKIDLKSTLNHCVNLLQSDFDKNSVNLTQSYLDKEDISILTLRSDLIDVIINILTNGNDILKTKESSKRIEIDYSIKNEKLIITFEDNGGGIEESNINKIFEPYFTTKHKSAGKGLSLYKSYKIVNDILNGKLYVKNNEFGAKFFIEFNLS